MTAQLDGAIVNKTTEYSGIQQMVRQAVQNASHEAEPEKSFLAKASVKMGNPPTYSSEHNLKKCKNWVFLGRCLTDEAQEWFYWQVEQFDREIKHWDLASIIMGLQKWFIPTLSLNIVAANYDSIMQGSMIVQQLHQEQSKLAKQIIELLDAYSYRRRFMSALKPDISEQVLKKGFTPKFSSIDELIDEAVRFDNAKHYTSGYNSNHGSSCLHKAVMVEHSRAQHTTTQNESKTSDNSVVLIGGENVRVNPTYGKNPVKPGNTVNKPTQSNPIRTAAKANNTVDRRVVGARIEEVILEEDEGQIEEFDEGTPHPEEQQDWEDQPEEDDQEYHLMMANTKQDQLTRKLSMSMQPLKPQAIMIVTDSMELEARKQRLI
ncbi:hypothetical protein M422DRAFT_258990 [Sphaerobolus stellatus SS14]|uniref:Uncharacterized protein n=1 Tax=Sphaerobolus stellatus (strain SS14) TaxID=990650 RepID=A0A0C9VKR4_SPHS4|nr:hypothetical protein M422DRAFT_258990 [Sphaerobolus stellatus SS14]